MNVFHGDDKENDGFLRESESEGDGWDGRKVAFAVYCVNSYFAVTNKSHKKNFKGTKEKFEGMVGQNKPSVFLGIDRAANNALAGID